MKIENPVIVALDYKDFESAKEIVLSLGTSVNFYKVGSVLFTRCSEKMISFLKEQNKQIFLDLKYHDIPNTVKEACYQAALLKVDLLTIHLSGGEMMIMSALEGVKEAKAEDSSISTKVLGVSLLTSIDGETLTTQLKVEKSMDDYIDHLIAMGEKCGIDGIVCSPLETKKIRANHGDDLLIINPGIRMPEDATGDQKRISTPDSAIKDGASYLVIGRSITGDKEPTAKATKIQNLIKRIQ